MNINPRMRFVWIAEAFLIVQLLFLWSIIVYLAFPFDQELFEGVPNKIFVLGPAMLFSILIIFGVAICAELYYRNFEYDFADDAFIVRKGIFTRKEYIIPYKDIDSAKVLRKGIHSLDQVFGLTCVEIKWNGKNVVVPGIAEPELFLRRLMAYVEGNEHIKNSEIYLSDREILLKLSSGLKALGDKIDQYVAEQKKVLMSAKARGEHMTDFIRPEFLYTDNKVPAFDIKDFPDLNKKEKGKKKSDGDDNYK
ncbi:MAG: PH domain-containing protein [Candidatus Micrarchaeia archaeon]